MEFVHLQVHSAYSLLTSSNSIDKLVDQAKELGFSALALTDENAMYGVVPFYKKCLEKGIKPIVGLTIYYKEDETIEESYPLVLLATNNEGYHNLIQLSTLAQTNANTVSIHTLKAHSKGLIAVSPGQEGMVESLILEGKVNDGKRHATMLNNLYGKENFYLSIQNYGTENQKKLMSHLSLLSEELEIPCVITNNVRYLNREDYLAYQCIKAIGKNEQLQSKNEKPNFENFLKSGIEIANVFQGYDTALKNTCKIAERCNMSIEFNQLLLPRYPVPEGETAHTYLEYLCEKGLQHRFTNLNPKIKERLYYELSVIKRMNFSDYFLIVWDFMRYAHRSNIMTGPGRGSAAGSLVAYALHITNVDPIKHELLFERFLNPERISMPDIDIDFSDVRRDEIIQYVTKKYGLERVAQIITFGTFGAKAALRDVGRVLGIPLPALNELAKKVPQRSGLTIDEAIKESTFLKNYIQQSEDGHKHIKIAKTIEGLPRHTSTHAAGVVMSAAKLTEHVPLQPGQEAMLTQYPMGILEEIGLLKMDFLGLRNLSLIEDILKRVHESTGKKINVNSIPLQDEKTYSLLSNGDTTGVFQLESEGMRNVLKKLIPTEFEDIVAVNALYRPGPMEQIPVYIRRKHRKETVTYLHSDLQPILQKTYGVIVYQEQIMQIAAKMAGFTLGQADMLRRAVSKKKKEILDEQRTYFVNGCLKKGYDEDTAHNIYDLIVKFANYGFNRSHAVAYSLVAYQLAYLKANYAESFMAALLTSAIGNEDKLREYIQEAKRKNISILPPSVNKSTYLFKVEPKGIRYSLAAIKHVGMTALKEIRIQRNKGQFKDLFDFCMRISTNTVNRKVTESLILAGAFDEFGVHRASLLATLEPAYEYVDLFGEGEENGFFAPDEFIPKPEYVVVEPFNEKDLLRLEKEAIGFYLSSHPLAQYKSLLSKANTSLIKDTVSIKDKMNVNLGVYLTKVKTINTRKGDVMAFVSLSDESGDMEGVVFPKIYAGYRVYLKEEVPILVKGTLETRDGNRQLILNEIIPLSQLKKQYETSLIYLKIGSMKDKDKLDELKKILSENHGNASVVLYYEDEKRTVKLSEEWAIIDSPDVVTLLKELLGSENVVVKK